MATDGMNIGYEPLDLNKKRLVEEVLAAEYDDAIIKVTKMRKRQPPKLRSSARNVAVNTLKYYSGVCVTVDAATVLLDLKAPLAEQNLHKFCSTGTHYRLDLLSKDITQSLAERSEVMKVQHHHEQSCVKNGSMNKMRYRRRFLHIFSPHMYNTDFIVDEKL